MTLSKQSKNRSVLEYQRYALSRVSRTFALTIPQLPLEVRFVIGNAYLLCRIADTIEDSPELDVPSKRHFLSRFAGVVRHEESVESFEADLAPLLCDGTTADDRDLVTNTNRVVDLHRQLPNRQSNPIAQCVENMCEGMSEFVDASSDGLKDVAQVERYCYFVAGVVGEMITEILCDYSSDIASRRDELYPLSSQFGCGLQLINIIKDHREDKNRGVCWLPRRGLEGEALLSSDAVNVSDAADPRIVQLLSVARNRLEKSLRYIKLIPTREIGIRRFLAWTFAFACLTLRRIHANPNFHRGEEVKISRRQVYATIATINLTVRLNRVLQGLFNLVVPHQSRFETLKRRSRR